ncbi:thymidylate kinase [Bifidobacterium actinocoloniiforme DSM 22766]|uniref:Thymidylate kinase n=1 Tax=Bifidobacterium actinocoloniiforme DSM 22766 TaxID=1437605 RepID=A0A086Z289_9BIFI|nr:thymidylate kinase [Bifidobacterium actinocoloniiforme DSM 22766]
MSQGLFISFEGVDGAGKTTQARRAYDFLQAKGLRSLITREPGGTPAGLAIRELVLHGMCAFPSFAVTAGTDVVDSSDDLNSRTEALLYAADRAEHVAQVIRPHLDRGDIILCDRYSDSSIAYQAGGRGLDEDCIVKLSSWAADGLQPARTYLLDVDPAQSHARVNDEPDRLEAAGDAFQEQVRAKFLELARQDPERFLVIDASLSVDEVWSVIQRDLETLTAGMPPTMPVAAEDDGDAVSLDEADGGDEAVEDELDDNGDDEDSDEILDGGDDLNDADYDEYDYDDDADDADAEDEPPSRTGQGW